MLYAQPFADEFALNDGAGKRRPAPVNQGRDCGAVRWNAAMATPLRIQGRMDASPMGKSGRGAPEIAPHVFTFRSVRSFRRRKNNMKKKYFSPSIQKVSFRYRDQVVAASGDPATPSDVPGEETSNGGWIWIRDALGNLIKFWQSIFG